MMTRRNQPASRSANQLERCAIARRENPAVPVRRVAIVLSELRPGGMERVVVQLASHLPRYGVEPMVVCLQHEGLLAGELKAAGVKIVALESMRGYDLRGLLALAGCVRRFRPDVINVHDYSSLPYTAVASLLRPGCPLVFSAHGLLYEGFEPLRRRLRVFSRRIRSLVAVSPQVRDRHMSYLNWRGPTTIVANGVAEIQRSAEAGCEVRKELGIPGDEFIFLAVGNLRPEKGFEDLLQAARSLRSAGDSRPFIVLIAGALTESDYCRNLVRLAGDSHVSGIRVLGYRKDVFRLYSAADAFVLSSRSEGLPLVLLEAMMAGLPAVATRVGAVGGVVTPQTGLLVDPRAPHELCRAMGRLMADPDLRQSLGSGARQRAVAEYGVETMITRYLDVFQRAVAHDTSDSR